MALGDWLPARPSRIRLRGREVWLRLPRMEDHAQWARLREASRGFLEPWEPIWPADDLTRRAFARRVRRSAAEADRDESYAFLIFLQADNSLVGGVALGQIRRGVAQTGTLGYWMGESFAGRGLMADALTTVCAHAFGPLRLHRLEAACLPSNARSINLLERQGFRREGLARDYLKIAGAWRDHFLYAQLEDDPRRRLEGS